MKRCNRPLLLEPLEPRTLLAANTVIDLLALYTPQAQQAAGSQSALFSKIESAVAACNLVLTNSLIPVRIQLAAMTLENYTESGDLLTDLNRLTNLSDGYMDNVTALRTWLGADLVTLFTSGGSPAGAGEETIGISTQLYVPTGRGNSEIAYSAVSQATAGGPNYTLMHEIGHNLGATHAVGDPTDTGATAYAHGYRFTGTDGVLYHDVMAYDPGQEIPYFSNPRITYAGVPEGDAATADVARVITEDAPIVAGYRTTQVIGALDVHAGGVVGGWAYDPANDLGAVPVTVYVDGKATTLNANTSRPDLVSLFGSANHGFSLTLSAGTHNVSAYAQTGSGQLVFLGSATVTDQLPIGRVEVLNATTVAGWAIDPDSASPVRMNLVVDGIAVATTLANTFRADLQRALGGTGKFGFSFALPGTLPRGIHRVNVYAVDNVGGLTVLLGSWIIDTNELVEGHVDVLNSRTIAGWAVDPNDASQAVQVRYSIDNNPPQFATASLSRPDLSRLFTSTNHGFLVTLPELTAGPHTIHVYAVDNDNKELVGLAAQVIVDAPAAGQHLPFGSLDIASSGVVAGWVYDRDVGAHPIEARVDIDGVAGTPFLANSSRLDLVQAYGTDQLGFYLPNVGLSDGPHRIDLYALDNGSGTPVLIASRLINDQHNFGAVTQFYWGGITGFAYAQAGTNHQANVRIDVDGLPGALIAANQPSPAVSATLGGGNFGFYVTPQLMPGRHIVDVWLIESVTDNPILLHAGAIVVPS